MDRPVSAKMAIRPFVSCLACIESHHAHPANRRRCVSSFHPRLSVARARCCASCPQTESDREPQRTPSRRKHCLRKADDVPGPGCGRPITRPAPACRTHGPRYSAAICAGVDVPSRRPDRPAPGRYRRASSWPPPFPAPSSACRPLPSREWASGGNRPKLTFIGWNERGAPASSAAMWPPVIWPMRAPSAVVAGSGSSVSPRASATAKRPAMRPMAALSTYPSQPVIWPAKRKLGPCLQAERRVEETRRCRDRCCGAAHRDARIPRSQGRESCGTPGPARNRSASSGSRPCCRACRTRCPDEAGRWRKPSRWGRAGW